MNTTAIIGLGNILLQDMSIGIYIVNNIKNSCKTQNISLVNSSVYLDLALAKCKKHKNIILISSMFLGLEPSSVTIIDCSKIIPLHRMKYTLYEDIIWEIISYCKKNKKNLTLVAIEPQNTKFGVTLSNLLYNKINYISDIVLGLL